MITDAIIGLAGVVIGSLSTLTITFINRRFDDRRHLREVAIQAAITHWDKKREMAIRINERTGQPATIAPLDVYIVHMLKLADLISKKNLTPENIGAELAKIRTFADSADKAYD